MTRGLANRICLALLMTQCFALALALNAAFAGYDKTDWGFSLKKVKTLYPHGYTEFAQNGEIVYSVVRPVAGLSTGYVNFFFSKEKGLKEVAILFPEQGTDVNLKEGLFTPMSKTAADSTFQLLKNALVIKYGSPDPLSKPKMLVWELKNGDVVTLIESDTDAVHPALGIKYSKIPKLSEISDGL